MTNKEAIEVLQNELDGIPFDLDKSDFEQALEIAIKAIRNEPIDDLSEYSDKLWQKAYERGKAEAITNNAPTIKPKVMVIEPDIIEKLADSVVDVISKIDWDKAIEAYKERPQGEWIPVSERLPEDMQKVLVWFEYYRYGEFNCMYQTYGFGYVCDGKWSSFINGETGWQDARIIAWQLLPEEYKEEENEDSN